MKGVSPGVALGNPGLKLANAFSVIRDRQECLSLYLPVSRSKPVASRTRKNLSGELQADGLRCGGSKLPFPTRVEWGIAN